MGGTGLYSEPMAMPPIERLSEASLLLGNWDVSLSVRDFRAFPQETVSVIALQYKTRGVQLMADECVCRDLI